jgi:protein farnesyltransferase/geranylgeranyltransferase type-1 subunit alpha
MGEEEATSQDPPERPLFALLNPSLYGDVKRIPQIPNLDEPFSIPYTEYYSETMSIYRGLLDVMELSPRALEVVTILNLDAASNPTPWWYRERIIEKLGYSLEDELAHCDECLQATGPKPYQVWSHRMWVMRRTDTPPDETAFFIWVITMDIWNFHAWSYFVWFAEKFGRGEWLFAMTKDVCTLYPKVNSAWVCRFQSRKMIGFPISDEIDFAVSLLRKDVENQSICGYLKGLIELDFSQTTVGNVKSIVDELLGEKPVRQLYILAAQIARKTGNIEAYNAYMDTLAALDPVRARAYIGLRSKSTVF